MTNQEFIKSISLEGEIWKDVIGYEGLYMVSSFGRIISLGRRITRPSHPNGFYLRQPKIMKQSISKSGYNKVILKVNGINKTLLVHRIVALSFISNIENKKEVDHINTDKRDNSITNLRWCTSKENSNNPITINNLKEVLKKNVKKGFLNSHSIPIIRISKDGTTKIYGSAGITKEDGFTPQEVSHICKYRDRTHKNYDWMRLSDYEALNKSKNESPDAEN